MLSFFSTNERASKVQFISQMHKVKSISLFCLKEETVEKLKEIVLCIPRARVFVRTRVSPRHISAFCLDRIVKQWSVQLWRISHQTRLGCHGGALCCEINVSQQDVFLPHR